MFGVSADAEPFFGWGDSWGEASSPERTEKKTSERAVEGVSKKLAAESSSADRVHPVSDRDWMVACRPRRYSDGSMRGSAPIYGLVESFFSRSEEAGDPLIEVSDASSVEEDDGLQFDMSDLSI